MYPFFPPENIRKPQGFLMFSGVGKGCFGNKSVKEWNKLDRYLRNAESYEIPLTKKV